MEHCDACQLRYDDLALDDLPGLIREQPARFAEVLRQAQQAGLERRRPRPQTWSALEYSCHVRDVLRVQRDRVRSALVEDRPTFPLLRRDELAVENGYNEQEIEHVLAELEQAADAFATTLESLDAPSWRRRAIYSWPCRAERDMAWIARHTAHEALHHLDDITRGLRELQEGPPDQ